jgi:segregation and condensation protein B
MNEMYLKNVVEAALLAAGKSLSFAELGQLFEDADRPAAADMRSAVARLNEDYAGRAMEIRETASGVRIQVRREFANEVARLWPERPQRYSRALLETLALIAYRQPITRAEIEAVRGVAVNPNITRTLFERNWVRVVGTRDLPGRPELLGTTREFLDYFGLQSLDELPPLAELRSLAESDPQLALPVPEDLLRGPLAAGIPPAILDAPQSDTLEHSDDHSDDDSDDATDVELADEQRSSQGGLVASGLTAAGPEHDF